MRIATNLAHFARHFFAKGLLLPLFMLDLVSGGLVAGQTKSATEAGERLAQWATVEAHASGVPVHAFGYTYVYAVSPDFRPAVVVQEGNDAPAPKIQPKKSWEIKNNLFGSTPAREPRTAANDDQRVVIGDYRCEYNQLRPHSRLGYLSPARFVAQLCPSPATVGLRPPSAGDGQNQNEKK